MSGPAHPSAATTVIALLGDPVRHSLSPRIHNAAFCAAGLDATYVALRCGEREVAGLLRGIALAGGGGNVTLPHKATAARTADVVTDAVRMTGACNTYWSENGRLHGDNTDIDGFDFALRSLVGDPAGMRVLLLGAGGAARAAVFLLLRSGVGGIDILNRTPSRARELRRVFNDDRRTRVLEAAAEADGERYDVVVNATSLGLRPEDELPLDLQRLSHAGAALDMVYAPGTTAWIRHARAQAVPAIDGIEMLLAQGAASFERWFQQPAPLHAMRAALESRD